MGFFGEVSQFLAANKGDALAPYLGGVQTALGHLQQASMWLSKNGLADPDNAGALARQAKGDSNPALDAKLTLARFFNERMLPETGAHLARLTARAATVMALPAEAF